VQTDLIKVIFRILGLATEFFTANEGCSKWRRAVCISSEGAALLA